MAVALGSDVSELDRPPSQLQRFGDGGFRPINTKSPGNRAGGGRISRMSEGAEPKIRRFGFGVPKPDGTFDAGWHDAPLTDAAWTEFQMIVGVAGDLRPLVVDHVALELDFNTLEDVEPILAHSARAIQHPFNAGEMTIISLAIAQRALSNFLASASGFRERALQDLIGRHGKASAAVKAFEAELSREYDTCFAYRLMYNLRNFSQHHDAPVSAAPLNMQRDQSGKWAEPHIRLVLNPDRLAGSEKVNAKVRTEIAGIEGPLELMPLAKEYMGCLRRLTRWLFLLETKRLGAFELYAMQITTRMGIPEGAVPVIWEGGTFDIAPGRPNKQTAHSFSFDELEIIQGLVGRLGSPNPERLELAIGEKRTFPPTC